MNKITYGVSEETYSLNNQTRTAYGIVIYSNAEEDGTATIVGSIRDVTPNKEKMERLVSACNKLELSPIHIYDVIDDFIG